VSDQNKGQNRNIRPPRPTASGDHAADASNRSRTKFSISRDDQNCSRRLRFNAYVCIHWLLGLFSVFWFRRCSKSRRGADMSLKSSSSRVVLKGPQCGADLRFLALRQTPVYTARPRILVHRAVCLSTPELSLVLIAPTHGGTARLS